jgi:hypothetical protein
MIEKEVWKTRGTGKVVVIFLGGFVFGFRLSKDFNGKKV